MRKYQTKQDREEKLKEGIFNVAMRLMRKIGYENLTIRDICDKADISTGMFYRHFKSKDELLVYYYTKAQKVFDSDIRERIAGKDIVRQLILYYTWYGEYTAKFGLDFCQNFFNSRNRSLNTNLYTNHVAEFTTGLLKTAVREGLVIPDGGTPESLSADFCVIVKGVIFHWCSHNGEYDLAEYVGNLVGRAMKGMLRETAAPSDAS